MNTQDYSLEDPPEHIIGGAAQVAIRRSDGTAPASAADPTAGWRMDGLLANLGHVVAYEREDGSMALSTWDGETTSVWAKFDVSPPPALVYMREHMVEAAPLNQPRPVGFIRVICFNR